MIANPPALLEEARRHDEAMTDGPWRSDVGCVDLPDGRYIRCCSTDATGIAWLRTNLGELIAGYTAALDEVERLRADHTETTNTYEERILELETASVTLRTSIGEQSLVIEQQDLDLKRLTDNLAAAHDMNRHYEQERDSWPLAYRQRAAKTDARIKELEDALTWACDGWQYQYSKRCEAEMRHMDAKVIERIDDFKKLLPSTGAPCPDTTK